MRAAVAIALLAAGCTRILGVHDFPPEVVDNKTCYGTMFPVCFESALPDPRTLSGAVDTDDALCRGTLADGSPACIIAATDLTITDLQAHGSLPLVLVAKDQLTITGLLDAASHGSQIGPNGSSAACIPATPGWGEDLNVLRGSGGGAGGSFGTPGGNGGAAQTQNGPNLGGGRTNPVATVIGLRGGCAGSAGGVVDANLTGGLGLVAAVGGAGGGAVVLVADAIEIDGTVDVSGAGGGAGPGGNMGGPGIRAGGGGGGAGSGGLIAIDAAIAMVSGMLVAHGGGGGGGGARDISGGPGADGGSVLDAIAAGGTSPNMQGTGGNGAGGTMAAQAGVTQVNSNDSGSGGGGGGAGVILSAIAIANASPAVSAP